MPGNDLPAINLVIAIIKQDSLWFYALSDELLFLFSLEHFAFVFRSSSSASWLVFHPLCFVMISQTICLLFPFHLSYHSLHLFSFVYNRIYVQWSGWWRNKNFWARAWAKYGSLGIGRLSERKSYASWLTLVTTNFRRSTLICTRLFTLGVLFKVFKTRKANWLPSVYARRDTTMDFSLRQFCLANTQVRGQHQWAPCLMVIEAARSWGKYVWLCFWIILIAGISFTWKKDVIVSWNDSPSAFFIGLVVMGPLSETNKISNFANTTPSLVCKDSCFVEKMNVAVSYPEVISPRNSIKNCSSNDHEYLKRNCHNAPPT